MFIIIILLLLYGTVIDHVPIRTYSMVYDTCGSTEFLLKVKLLPKCNLCFFCECIWVKPSCKSIISTKEMLLRFTIFSFSGHFHWSAWGALFKTPRRLNTTWNFACSITRVSTHEHEHWEHCLWTHSLLKRKFLNNSPWQLLVPLPVVISHCKFHFKAPFSTHYCKPLSSVRFHLPHTGCMYIM